jgi:hypothetical protein
MKAVGIIIPTKERFNKWVSTFGIPEERYVFLDRKEKCFGNEFIKVLKSDDWRKVKDCDNILKCAEIRVR